MVGHVYNVPPMPPDPAHTTYLDAGALRFGVEYREVDPQALAATYGANDEHMAEIDEHSPEGGFEDEGVSIHVIGADDGHEYLRFDIFDDEPHYHYIHRSGEVNNVVEFDRVALGDMAPWALGQLRTRLPEMLSEAQGAHLVPSLDGDLIDRTVEEVAAIVDGAQRSRAGD